jgi:hypothetical protein
MTTFFRSAPQYEAPLVDGKNTSTAWYRWFQAIDNGIPPSDEAAVTVTGSPFIYTAPSKGFAIVSGGTVSDIEFSRTVGVFYPTGQTAGVFPMSANDQLKITFSGVPSAVFVAQ